LLRRSAGALPDRMLFTVFASIGFVFE